MKQLAKWLCVGLISLVYADDFAGIDVSCPRARKVAPPVSSAMFVRVISAQGGIENIAQGQQKVRKNHSKEGLRVITAVCGYGGKARDVLHYLGTPQNAMSEHDIDSNGDGIADGFLILWNLDGKNPGATAHYEAYSVNGGTKAAASLQLRP